MLTCAIPMTHHKQRTSLDLEHCGIGGEGCTAIARGLTLNGSLRMLTLAGNRIGPRGCDALGTGAILSHQYFGLNAKREREREKEKERDP